jgi:hypothetical protein
VKLIVILIFLIISTPFWLIAVDFYEQIACSKYQMMCRVKMINWNRGRHDERAGNEDFAQSLRFFGRSNGE